MWSNVSLSTTSFPNSSCGWEGLAHISPGLLPLTTEGSQARVLSRSHRDGCRRELKQGIWPLRGDAWCRCFWGLKSPPWWSLYAAVSYTASDLSPREFFRRSKGRKQDFSDWVLDIMLQCFYYVLFAVKPRNCRSIHLFLEASARGLRAVTYRRSGSSLCRLAALKSSSHARIGEEVFQ